MSTFPLPSDQQEWGYVTGRLIEQVLDTPADPDDKPEARGVSGDIVFTPRDVLTTSETYAAFVMTNPFVCPLNADGELTTPVVSGRQVDPGAVGVWLPIGVYTVSFPSGGPEEFEVLVETRHTLEAPMVLSEEAGYQVPEGTVTQLMLVPSGFPMGHLYAHGPNDTIVPVNPDSIAPVRSVNGRTGSVSLGAADVGADPAGTAAGLVGGLRIPSTAADVGADPAGTAADLVGQLQIPSQPSDVGADPAGTATAAVDAHEARTDPHPQYLTESDLPALPDVPVQSVAGRTGDVTLSLADVSGVTPAAIGAATPAQVTSGDAETLSSAQAYAQGLVEALTAASPATLDTLAEIAEALGQDPNFAATMTTALANRVRHDAPQSLTVEQQDQARANIRAAAELVAGQNYLSDEERAKLAAISGTNTGDQVLPTWETLEGRPAEFAPTTHTHPVSELETAGTPDETTFLRGDGTWATPEGGEVAPGTMVWRGDFDPAAAYDFGDVVSSPLGTFVALEESTGVAPTLPTDPLTDNFDRADGPLGNGWTLEGPEWVIASGAATRTDFPAGSSISGFYRQLSPYGTLAVNVTTGERSQIPRVVFGRVDSGNYLMATFTDFYTANGGLFQVVEGVSTPLVQFKIKADSVVEITRTSAGSVTIREGGVTLVDGFALAADAPAGDVWGVEAQRMTSNALNVNTVDDFTFTPEPSTTWKYIERDFAVEHVTGLPEALAGKADAEHTHAVAEIETTGTPDATTFLRGDGTWAIPEGGTTLSEKVLALGTSIAAGEDVTAAQAYPARTSDMATAALGESVTVVPAGVSGDTTAQMLARLPALLDSHAPAYVTVEASVNDTRTDFSITTADTISNLRKIVAKCRLARAVPVLMTAGWFDPAVFVGPYDAGSVAQAEATNVAVLQLGEELSVAVVDIWNLVPHSTAYLTDGLHPNASGHDIYATGLSGVIVQNYIAPEPPAPPVELVVQDDFERAESTTTLGSAATGQAWEPVSGVWGIGTGRAYMPTPVEDGRALIETGLVDQDISSEFLRYSGTANVVPSLIARATDGNNYYLADLPSADNGHIYKKVNGTYTVLAATSQVGQAGTSGVIRFTVVGNVLTLYANGTQVLQVTDNSLTSGTKAGLRQAQTTKTAWETFEVRDPNYVPADPGAMVWRGDWVSSGDYATGDVVISSEGIFVALRGSVGITPSVSGSPLDWSPLERDFSVSDIEGLPAALDGKATTAHTHAVGDITATGTADSTTYLRGDGTWAVPDGGGEVVFKPVTVPDSQSLVVESSASVTVPSVTFEAGDMLLATVMHRSELAVPEGWSVLSTSGNPGATQWVTFLYMRTPASGTQACTFTQAEVNRMAAAVSVVRNVKDFLARGDLTAPTVSIPVKAPAKATDHFVIWAIHDFYWTLGSTATVPWSADPILPSVSWPSATSTNSPRLGVFFDNEPSTADRDFISPVADADGSLSAVEVLPMPATWAPSEHTHVLDDIATTGTPDETTFLRGDGSWAVPPAGSGGGGATTLADLTDVSPEGALSGQALVFNGVEWVPAAVGSGEGGGGSSWIQNFTESGSSLDQFQPLTGTWAVDNGSILQSAVSTSTTYRIASKERVFTTPFVLEGEIMLLSGGSGTDRFAGFIIAYPNNSTSVNGAIVARLQTANGTSWALQVELDGSSARSSVPVDMALNEWQKIRIVYGGMITVYFNDVLVSTTGNVPGTPAAAYIAMNSRANPARFRNIRTWRMATPQDGSSGGLVGLSAYEVATANGFVGSSGDWLASLKGRSAYEVAVANGFVGTETEWLISLKSDGSTALETGTLVLYPELGDDTTEAGPYLQTLLDQAHTAGGGHVYVPAGTYRVGQALEIGSNTHLELSQGATIKRNTSGNLLLTNKHDGTTGGYGQARNIRVSGGTWDGNRGEFTSNHTLIGFGHCESVTVENAVITNLAGDWHNVEFNAVRGGRIIDCEFSDSLSGSNTELIQLDLAKGAAQFPWFGPFDNTPCRDILIEGNYFHDTLNEGVAGIGSHSATAGSPSSTIVIQGNQFRNVGTAIKPYDWTHLTIQGNTIVGCHAGIRWNDHAVSTLGDITISGNVIAATSATAQGRGIWVAGGPDRRISRVTIVGNTISNTSQYGISADYCDGVVVKGNLLDRIGTATGTSTGLVAIWAYRNRNITIEGNRVTNTNPTSGTSAHLADIKIGENEEITHVVENAVVVGNLCQGSIEIGRSVRTIVAHNHCGSLTVQTTAAEVQQLGNFVADTWVPGDTGGSGVVVEGNGIYLGPTEPDPTTHPIWIVTE